MGVDVLMARLSADELVDGGDVATPKLETDYGNRGQTDTTTVATPTSTNQKIADTIAAYAANNPAPAGTHYGKTLDASGKPILYTNVSAALSVLGGTTTGGGTTATTAAPATPTTSAADTAFAAQIAAQTAQAQAAQAASQQNAITFLTQTFTDMGLGADIASAVTDLVKQGYTADTIQLMAQDPKSTNPLAVAFQQRFPANAARMAAGLPVLSPAEYLATERSYAQVLGSYGLNNNFATNKDVFTKLLTNDISPTELNSRASTAKQVIENTDPAVTQQLQAFYGLTQGDMIAHVLDPSIATPIIEKQISTAQIGAEASRYGANINQSYGEQLTALGITQAQAAQGFQNIAQQQAALQSVASANPAYLQAGSVGSALQAATFGTTGAVQSQQELDRLKAAAANPFGGSSGVSKGSLMGSEEGIS